MRLPTASERDAVVGDEDGVLELRGARAVGGGRGPAVGPDDGLDAAHGDHGLDGEDHARLHAGRQRALVVVRDLRRAVEHLADAVADEGPHDEEAGRVRVGLDRQADVGERRARPSPRRCACSRHSSVTFTSRRDSASTLPTQNVALVSPCTPST